MWNAMSVKDAVKQWEVQNQQKITAATEIKLTGINPPLDKMDTVMLTFTACEKLSLSSNAIERIANLGSMKHLKILSLGRNNIKSISGIESVSETLEELWISYNQIEKLKGIGVMKKLRILTMSNNHVREWSEFMRLSEMPNLKELVFVGNPLEERCTTEGTWRSDVVRRLPGLSKLDGHQCMETEVNLSDAQTELQKNGENNQGDRSKFDGDRDDDEDDEDEDDEDEDDEEQTDEDEDDEERSARRARRERREREEEEIPSGAITTRTEDDPFEDYLKDMELSAVNDGNHGLEAVAEEGGTKEE